MMKNRRNKVSCLIAAAIITSMISITIGGNAYADLPKVTIDETLYANLDYYGKQKDSIVVKGVTLNGLRTFTDYGEYNQVINMSNYAKPVIQKDHVSWQLPEDAADRFYYECKLNTNEVVLPWKFDVSYKLNGVPKRAQELLHANGLIEMDIHCIPDENAKTYYKDNMLLQISSVVDMEKVSSVEAPGSQTQSFGSYKVVLFAAVPGQEKTFHIEISSHNFEFNGIVIMMVPGTLDQISEIADIKSAKDTFEKSTDEFIDGMNEMLDTLNNISNSMTMSQKGLQQLQEAKKNFDGSKDQMIHNAEKSIDSLDMINAKLTLLSPDIQANKQAIDEINGKVNGLIQTFQDSGDDFYHLSASLRDLNDNIEDLQSNIYDSDADDIKEEILEIEEQLTNIENTLKHIVTVSKGAENLSEEDMQEQEEKVQELIEDISGTLDDLEPIVGVNAVSTLRDQLNRITTSGLDGEDASSIAQMAAILSKIIKSLQNMLSSVRDTISDINMDNGLKNGKSITNELASVSDNIDTIIGDIESLNKAKNDNKAAFDLMLDDTAASIEQINAGILQLSTLFRSILDTVNNNRYAVENGTNNILDGLIDVLEKTSKTSGTFSKLKQANESLRSSVKDEIDKFGDESNVLNMNSNETMVSFTSDKNLAPSSIQVILRTAEICDDSVNDNSAAIESKPVDVGVWQRIKKVFKKIIDDMMGIFA